MKITSSKNFKRFTSVSLVASVVVAGGYAVSATPATPVNVEDVVSNELNITFSVADVIKENVIVLTWSVGNNNALKEVTTKKGQTENVSVDINRGSEFEEKTIAILLEVPIAEVGKIDSITLSDGETVATSFTVDGNSNTYYLIGQGIEVKNDSTNLSTDFNITFSEATNTDISARIFAVADVEQEVLDNDGRLQIKQDSPVLNNLEISNDDNMIYIRTNRDTSEYVEQLVDSIETIGRNAEFKIFPINSSVDENNFDTESEANIDQYIFTASYINSSIQENVFIVVKAEDGTLFTYEVKFVNVDTKLVYLDDAPLNINLSNKNKVITVNFNMEYVNVNTLKESLAPSDMDSVYKIFPNNADITLDNFDNATEALEADESNVKVVVKSSGGILAEYQVVYVNPHS